MEANSFFILNDWANIKNKQFDILLSEINLECKHKSLMINMRCNFIFVLRTDVNGTLQSL